MDPPLVISEVNGDMWMALYGPCFSAFSTGKQVSFPKDGVKKCPGLKKG